MKRICYLVIGFLTLHFAGAQDRYQDMDQQIKQFRKEGYAPVRDFDPKLADQLHQAANMARAQNEKGDFLYTIVSGRSEAYVDLREATVAAYVRAMEEFLSYTQENQIKATDGNSQNIIDTGYGKFIDQRATIEEEGDSYDTFSRNAEFIHQMLIKSSTSVGKDHIVKTKISLAQKGFPLFGLERVVNLYRMTENGKYEVLCFLAIDKYWLDHESIQFDNE